MGGLEIITKKEPNGIATVVAKGIIDAYSYAQLEQTFNRLIEERVYKFIVDLSEIDYMSSTGAGIFIGMLRLTQENNGNIILVNPKPMIKDLFDLLGLTNLITITKDRKSAFSTFNHKEEITKDDPNSHP